MNKHCYRIVFNKTRGMPMVVAESARSQGGAGAPDGAGDLRANPPARRVAFALSTLALGVLLITGGMSWSSSAGAQIVADRSAPGARQATVLNTANGVLQVNIQTPSAAGVSHNVYSQFDVPARGAILNNTRSGANTRLGGLVPGNPWLAGGTARVILNEVNATSPSQLRGYVEVGGDRAEVVIANPAGIVCDGCGFINASRSTLTTGAPLLSNGSLDGFRVQGGRIVVQGAGLDAADSDYTGLIARAVELNAGIWANDLRVITGAAEVSADAASATALAASGPAPAFALDVALLGGMYANKITLVGAEAGLGMRSAGHIGAAAGAVVVTTAGWLENAGQIDSNTRLHISAAGPIGNSGTLLAGTDASLSTPDNITLGGTLIARGDVLVAATGSTAWIEAGASSSLIAGRQADGTLGTTGTLQLKATRQVGAHGYSLAGNQLEVTGGAIDLRGGQVAARNLLLEASALGIDLSTSHITAQDTLMGTSPGLLRTAHAAISAQSLRLDARSLDNTGGELIQFGSNEMHLQLPGELTNSSGRIASNATMLRLGATTLDNTGGRIEHAGSGGLEIRTQSLAGSGGKILSNGLLDLHNTDQLNNQGGQISSTGALTLNAAGVDNTGGSIQSSQASVRIGSGSFDNSRGQLFAATDLTLGAQSVLNPDGSLYAGHSLALALTGTLTHSGTLAAGQNVTVSAKRIDASATSLFAAGLQSDGSLTLNAAETLVAHGRNLAAGAATLHAASLDLSASQTTARVMDLQATAGLLDTRQAILNADETLTLRAGGQLDNRHGSLSAARLDVQAHSLDNTDGELLHTGSDAMSLLLPGELTNNGGRIASNARALRLGATTLDNTGGRIEHAGTGSLEIRSQNLAGSGGQILSNGLLDLRSTNLVLDAATTRAAQLAISADTFSHRDGRLVQTGTGAGQLSSAGLLDNQRGQIVSNGALNLTAGSIDNRGGDILTSGTQNLTARLGAYLDNREGGRLRAGGVLDLGATSLDNSSGELSAGTSLGITVTRAFTNVAGLAASTGALTVTAGALDNTGGSIQSSQASMRIDSGSFDNSRGQLFAATDLTLGAQNILNPDGNLYAGHALSLALTGTLTHGGTLAAGQNVTVSAKRIDASATSLFTAGLQSDGSLGSSGALTLNAAETLIAHGRNLAAGAATLSAASLDLSASQTTARVMDLQATAGLLDTRQAILNADETLTLRAGGQLDNRHGSLSAARLDVQAHSLDNTDGELLHTGSDAMSLLLPGELTNNGGRIASNASTLRLGATTLDNAGGRIEHAGSGSLEIRSQNLAGSGGQILSNGLLDLRSTNLVLDAATTRAAQLAISADTFSHRDGRLVQTGTGAGQLSSTGLLDNQRGQIASNGALDLTAGSIDNRGGDILTSGTQNLTARLGAHLDNRDRGRLRAGATLDLGAASVDNSGGELVAGAALGITLSNALINVDGFVVGHNGVSVQAGSLDNTRGTLAATLGAASVQIGTTLDNHAGKIGAHQQLTVSAASLDNRAGTLAASSLTIDAGRGKIDNRGGQLVAGGAQDAGQLTLDSGLVDNTGGLIQARGRLALDTHDQTLINRETAGAGGILGGAALSVRSAALDNSQGYIGSQKGLEIRATTVDNTHGGLIGSAAGIDLLADSARNLDGRLLGAGDLGLTLTDSFDNTAGLVRAGGRLALDAASVINTRTQGDGLGLEGREVHLGTAQLDNRDGALRADTALSVTSAGRIDNTRGLISSLGTLALTDPATLARTLGITHTGGTLLAGTGLSIDALSLSGDGQLLSGGDLAVRLASAFDNRGAIHANGNARLDINGTLTNRATLAGGTLQLGASTFDNRDGGEVRAAQIRFDTRDAFTNRGLIDADEALITSPLVDNLGSGRIYGTHLAIAATTLNNLPEAGLAPVIAARARLDLGIGTLENRDHALIFSAGDMAIGASLDAHHFVSGQAEHLTNASATIEALGQLALAARRTDNLDAHFATHIVETATEAHLEYAFNGSPTHYDERAIKITYRFRDDGVRTLNVLAADSDGHELKGESFSEFRFTRTIHEEQILSADPGRILAGGNLLLSGDSLTNDKSQIVAGGKLSATLGSLSNIAATGLRTIQDVGTATAYWRHKRDGTDSQGSSATPYLPALGVESVTLATPLFAQHSSLGGSAPVIPPSESAGLTPTAQGADLASSSQRSQAIVEVAASLTVATPVDSTGLTIAGNTGSTPDTAPPVAPRDTQASTGPDAAPAVSLVKPADGPTAPLSKDMATPPADAHPQRVIRSLTPALTLPDNRLFTVRPEPGAPYLVETDPRFTDTRIWLNSSFMLSALSVESTAIQKRLGDGFYEQQRVREQVAQLTGRRFLDGYANDEAQYQDLMRAGLVYAKAWNLIPGVALSAAQMAQLTTDIVWLIDTPVTLADGSVQHVLAPQVYVRVRDGDIDGSGALLSGNSLNLNLGDTLLNSGTVAGRQWVDLSADTLTNLGGRVRGDSVALNALLDITNLGGRMEAMQALELSAGRDIRVASTTRSSTSEQGSRTQRDRLAGLYVSGGSLTVQAGRDIQFDAAELINSAPTAAGPTTLAAGRDLNLGTVTESAEQRIVWDGKNRRSEAGTTEIGSTIRTQGDLQLIAGQDLSLRAANLTSQAGVLQALAGRDLTLAAGQATARLDEAHQHQEQGFLKKTTITTRDTLDQSTALATTLSGNTTSVAANQNVRIQGSNVVSSQGTQVLTGRDLSIEAAIDTRHETHAYTEKQSGLFSGGGFGITIGTQQQKTDQDMQGGTAAASTIGSTAGNVLLQAGQAYTQTGSDMLAPQGSIDIVAPHVDIVAAREVRRSQTNTQFTQSGLTLALSSPLISAIQTAVQMKDAASQTTDSRMQALAAANAGMAAYNAATAVQESGASSGINLTLSLGASRSRSQVVQNSDSGRGSTVSAGGDVAIAATGAKAASDLTVQGSTLQAGNDIRLAADNAIQLLAGKNTADQQSTNNSVSGAVGINIGSRGLGVTLSASAARGKADGNDVTYANSHVEAGRQLILQSGGDTTLKGALAKAEQITAEVSGHLAIDSLQDTSTFKSRQQSLGGSVTVGAGASGSLSFSQSKIDSDFASVAEQSGLKTGDGGFQVAVKGDADLKGGAITSTDKAVQDGKNRFQTGGTLTTSDIRNQADYRASSVGINLGTSQANDGQFKPMGNSAGFGHDQGQTSSTTQATISGIAGNRAARTGDAETGIQKIFDADKVQKDVTAQVLITQTFGAQASKVVGDYANTQTRDYEIAVAARDASRKNLETETDPAQQAELQTTIAAAERLIADRQDAYDNWKEGGAYRVALHTVVGGLLSGNAAGLAGAGATAAAAPRIDALTKNLPEPVSQAAGMVLGSVIGAVAGSTTGGGLPAMASGAAAGLVVDANNRQLHISEIEKLKQKAEDQARASLAGRNAAETEMAQAKKYWFDLLSSEALAVADATANRARTDYLGQVEATSQPGLAGQAQAERYLQDAATARQIVASMSGALLIGTDGKPIVADGAAVRAFQSTDKQFADSQLFLARDAATLSRQFGSSQAASDASARESSLENRVSASGRLAREDAQLSSLRVPSEGVTRVYPELDLLPALGPVRQVGKVLVREAEKVFEGASRSAEAVIGREVGGSYVGKTIDSVPAVVPPPIQAMSPTQVMEEAERLGFRTERDTAVFWSNLGPLEQGVNRARLFAAENGGVTLEMTPGGKWLSGLGLYGPNSSFSRLEADQIIAYASRSLATQASGQVRVVSGAIRPSSFYLKFEWPALSNNPGVTGIDYLQLKPSFLFGGN